MNKDVVEFVGVYEMLTIAQDCQESRVSDNTP